MKPNVLTGYKEEITAQCERVLVSLLRGFGPWKDSVYLVGGLAPRYLAPSKPPGAVHAGTGDVDLVVDMAILTDVEAYHTLEDNLKKMGFERAANEQGKKVNWRWKAPVKVGAAIVIEFLADDPKLGGGKVQELPTEGNVSAINIPFASMVFDLHEKIEVTAELLNGDGKTTETISYADIVSFTCLKAFAFDHRGERKDAHDLIFCLENTEGGIEKTAEAFTSALKGKHAGAIQTAIDILKKRFCDDEKTEGHEKDGPTSLANFEIEGNEPEDREARSLRRRQASDLVMSLVKAIQHAG